MDNVITLGDGCTLFLGDCLDVLKTLPADSVDAIVTDPPAGICFMGKDWDHHKGGRKQWIAWMTEIASECLRVLKPGGHALVWAIPRTSHWTATAWEKAGFEIRDRIAHVFSSGFPKSADVSKMIDKLHGEEREVVSIVNRAGKEAGCMGATDQAKQWQGWGTTLKPAMEDWWLCRKPLEGTVAANVLKHGVGGINVDGCRVPVGGDSLKSGDCNGSQNHTDGWDRPWRSDPEKVAEHSAKRLANAAHAEQSGRFPANLIHDGSDEVMALFPQARSSGIYEVIASGNTGNRVTNFGGRGIPSTMYDDSGSAARFFYCAKASQEDRDEGIPQFSGPSGITIKPSHGDRFVPKRNHHPTVKPTELMRHLCRLITPPGGILLDPFMGSGSTGKAAMLEGFRFIGIEREPDYIAIAQARIRAAQQRAFDARRQQVMALEPAPEKPASQPALQSALPLEAAA